MAYNTDHSFYYIGQPGAPIDVVAVVSDQSLSLSWKHTSILENSQLYNLYYAVSYCVLVPYYRNIVLKKSRLVSGATMKPIVQPAVGSSNNSAYPTTNLSKTRKMVSVPIQRNVTIYESKRILRHHKRNCIKVPRSRYGLCFY